MDLRSFRGQSYKISFVLKGRNKSYLHTYTIDLSNTTSRKLGLISFLDKTNYIGLFLVTFKNKV